MEIIAQAVRVIDYENNSVQRRNVNMMPKFKDYIEQLIVHVSNNVSIREYHTQSTRTEVIAGILEIAGNLETPDAIEEKIDSIAERLVRNEREAQARIGHMNISVQKGSLIFALFEDNGNRKCISVFLLKLSIQVSLMKGTTVKDLDSQKIQRKSGKHACLI